MRSEIAKKVLRILLPGVLLVMTSCEGDQGAQGPAGPGNREVIITEDPIPASPNPYELVVPQIQLADLPSITVFVRTIGNPDRWGQISSAPTDRIVAPAGNPWYTIGEGKLLLSYCEGLYVMVVLVD